MSGSTSKPRNKYVVPAAVIVILLLVAVGAGLYLSKGSTSSSTSNTSSSSGGGSNTLVPVVAAENFWGSLVGQLGGTRVNVTSIVSDPNTDPHEYQSAPANAIAIANAKFVIINGADYDTWAQALINASNTKGQTVLDVQDTIGLAGQSNLNPHFWYSPYYVNDTVHAMYKDLVAIDPTDTTYFKQNYAALNSSLWTSYMQREAQIKQQFAGRPVAATEDIFVYMANATGLKVVSPPGFMSAVAEGNDPAAQDVATFQQLLQGGNSAVSVLVYNEQTVTPLTQNIKALATSNQIPVIGVTETIQPPDLSFQNWMSAEVASLQNALNAAALGQ